MDTRSSSTWGGGGVNFVARDRFVNPGTILAFPEGGFSVWEGLQETEDVGSTIAASDADTAYPDGRNTQAEQIFQA